MDYRGYQIAKLVDVADIGPNRVYYRITRNGMSEGVASSLPEAMRKVDYYRATCAPRLRLV
jgi:hypothetical protein